PAAAGAVPPPPPTRRLAPEATAAPAVSGIPAAETEALQLEEVPSSGLWPDLPGQGRASLAEPASQLPGQWLEALARAERLAGEQGAR
ncbi:hypothetical protein D477_021568, partial [Arthrobacter crystallopoietes BAB-32]